MALSASAVKDGSTSKMDGGNIVADSSISPCGTHITSSASTNDVDFGGSGMQTKFKKSVHKAGTNSSTAKEESRIPPQERGVFRMSSDHKLQVLLTRIATQDSLYSGLEDETPAGPGPSPDDWSSKDRPTSLPSLGDPPTPPSMKYVRSTTCKHVIDEEKGAFGS